jgi:hypothetical protein
MLIVDDHGQLQLMTYLLDGIIMEWKVFVFMSRIQFYNSIICAF